MTTIENKREYSLLIDLFYLAIVLLACVKLTYGITSIVDFMFADESFYMTMGVKFKLGNLFQDGGVYFLWMRMLIELTSDLIHAYCWNYAILISINPVLIYILARKMGKAPFTGAFFSIFFLVTSLNVITWPFITRFSTAIFLLSLIFILSVKKNMVKYIIAIAGLFVLVYIRPEFLLALLVFSIVSIFYFMYIIKKDRAAIKTFGLLALIPLALIIFVMFMKNPAASGRSTFAFGQHYGANMQKAGELKTKDVWSDWRGVMKEKFKTDSSLITAFLNNPGEVFKHISMNIKQFPYEFFYQLFPFQSGNFKPPAKQVIKYIILLLFLLPFIYFIWRIAAHIRNKNPEKKFSDDEKFVYLVSTAVALPVLFSLFVIAPRTHYMLALFGIILPVLILNTPKFIDIKIPKVDFPVKAVFALLLLVWVPWKVTGTGGILPTKPVEPCSYIKRTLAVKEIKTQTDVRLLEMILPQKFCAPFFKMYLEDGSGHSYQIFETGKGENLNEFIKKNQINMIYVDKKLLSQAQVEMGADWARFEVPRCKEYVLVRKDILKKQAEGKK